MKRHAFTMIELIFVIVILGILAAVALPKLAATRDDAKLSSFIANTRTTLGDFKSFYTSQGQGNFDGSYIEDITDVPLETACGTTARGSTVSDGSSYVLCDSANGSPCLTFSIAITATDSNLTITDDQAATPICQMVSNDPVIGVLASPGGTNHALGGKKVVR